MDTEILRELIEKANSSELEVCSNCEETEIECACIRNKCIKCGKSVGNITFTICDNCWNLKNREL